MYKKIINVSGKDYWYTDSYREEHNLPTLMHAVFKVDEEPKEYSDGMAYPTHTVKGEGIDKLGVGGGGIGVEDVISATEDEFNYYWSQIYPYAEVPCSRPKKVTESKPAGVSVTYHFTNHHPVTLRLDDFEFGTATGELQSIFAKGNGIVKRELTINGII